MKTEETDIWLDTVIQLDIVIPNEIYKMNTGSSAKTNSIHDKNH